MRLKKQRISKFLDQKALKLSDPLLLAHKSLVVILRIFRIYLPKLVTKNLVLLA